MNYEDPRIAVPTSRGFRVSTDLYLQRFIKYPRIAECHSYSELLYLALLEFDPSVSSFTPQPKQLKIGGRRYVPDCFFVRGGERFYVELKPRGEFKESLHKPLIEYARRQNSKFEVISNESVLEHEQAAKNSLLILRVLLSSVDEDTDAAEEELLSLLLSNISLRVAEIIDHDDRIGNRHKEIALYRLVHKGLISIEIDQEPIGYQTVVRYGGESKAIPRSHSAINQQEEHHVS